MKKNSLIIIAILVVIIILGLMFGRTAVRKLRTLTGTQPLPAVQPTTNPAPTPATSSGLVMMKTSVTLGSYTVGPNGMTLYTFDKDQPGVSNCTGQCLVNWPPYLATSPAGNFPANIGTMRRSDGSVQYTWKGMPIYYYSGDKNPGDTNGDGVGGVWHVAK